MKSLVFSLFFLTSSLSTAANYEFKEAHFSVAGLVKKSPDRDLQAAFKFTGRALLIEDTELPNLPQAQITVRRTTYACDDVNYNYKDEYTCSIAGTRFLQLLDEVANQEGQYAAAIQILKSYFDDAIYYNSVTIPLGSVDQISEEEDTTEFRDPMDDDSKVEITTKTSGFKPL